MKKYLGKKERQRMVDLLDDLKSRGEDGVASIVQLAIIMSDKGEYDKFQEVFSNE